NNVAVDAINDTRQLLGAFQSLTKPDPRLMAGPVGKVRLAGQRAVDPRRRDFKAIGAFDGVAPFRLHGVEQVRELTRNRLAIVKAELAGVAALGHDLQGR